MSVFSTKPPRPAIVYPDSDGKPMAENTLQFEWIVTIKEGLERVFSDRPDVFVAGDLLWYPVEGDPKISAAPDTMVAFGRPKGYRGSYKQFEEGGIAPQVVFEVLSPNNFPPEMARKLTFYERHGVDEYYIYDPDDVTLTGYLRSSGGLRKLAGMNGWISPRLGIRFTLNSKVFSIHGPDGQPFLTYQEIARERDEFARQRDEAMRERDRATTERDRATKERDRATKERELVAEERDAEHQRVKRLLAQLRALGVEPPE